ncbi:MAG: 23S rRNA (uracil(1939)-C(5))-methyltransferase RlmD [Bacillales bacterium]|jgi:23S rRNA (uracil1939-C5)-methyltransferase|nr:23S rRNA (uracil(1939)-C(5))-methyltransferase RlmD [Bacillales bacterium]
MSIISKCLDYTFQGYGVVKENEKVIFVPYLLLDEVAEIEVAPSKKTYAYAEIIKIIEVSPHRVIPSCPVFSFCGSCNLLHMDYLEQLNFKKILVTNSFKKLFQDIADVVPCLQIKGYRNKITLNLQIDLNKNVLIGFYERDSHHLVNFDNCLLLSTNTLIVLKQIREHFQSLVDKVNMDYLNLEILILSNEDDSSLLLKLSHNSNIPAIQDLSKKLFKNDFIKGLEIRQGKDLKSFQNRKLITKIGDYSFESNLDSFRQVNRYQTETLYNLALLKADLKPTEKLLDAYSGIGTIGIMASKYVKEVIGFDISEANYLNALSNIRNNNIENMTYYKADSAFFKLDNDFDVIIVDPPRAGLTKQFLRQLMEVKAFKLIYISCDLTSLIRDLNDLIKIYDITSVTPVDMFPHTLHVETVVSLRLAK